MKPIDEKHSRTAQRARQPQQGVRTAKARSERKKRAARQRIEIEKLTPCVDGGRFAAKRVIGDDVIVSANVFKDGHDLISGRIAYKGPRDGTWHYAPMTYDVHFDRCTGRFTVDRLGVWSFTVEAWVDLFATWRHALEKKHEAGQDISMDLLEGAAIVEQAWRQETGDRRATLKKLTATIRDETLSLQDRVDVALSDELASAISTYVDKASLTRADVTLPLIVDRERARFSSWYEMFPRSQGTEPGKHGTFRDAERRLPELAELGFDVIYLPPIHPIGHTKRKGKNNTLAAAPDDPGSPWAIGSDAGGYTAIEPQLGTMKDFERFVARANALGMEIALDYALQCSPDHPWVREHPDWFFVRADGSIKHAENPPKKYEDIYPPDFWCDDYERLWAACKDVLLFWIEKGVKIFRVDNPHTKPYAFWEWAIQEVRRDHPDMIFLSEAFTRPARMKGLAKRGFNQSYTYFTWRNSASELREYLIELTTTDMREYFRPNFFANTPDILHEYLQRGGRPAFRVRLLLAATLSPAYGIYSGFELCENIPVRPGSEEYLNSEKYEIRVRDFNAPGNLNQDIARINQIRRDNRALQLLDNLSFEHCEHDEILFYHKSAPGNDLLIAVNLNPFEVCETMVHVPLAKLGLPADAPFAVEDLLTGDRYTWRGERNFVRLDPQHQPGHVLKIHKAH